ncbi:MAG: flagellar hook capping FlgD N-terminal domain-containing protein [Acidithiobacillus sp.]
MSISSVLNSSQPVAQQVPASALTSASSSGSGAASSGQMLTEQDFLTLLITQLQNQDPTKPASDTQLAQEMASFTTANGMSSADTLLQQISTGIGALNTALGIGSSGATTSGATSSSTATSGAAA